MLPAGLRSLPAVLLCAASAAAQGTFVVPPRALSHEPGAVWSDDRPQFEPLQGGGLRARAQYLYDATTVPLTQTTLRALSFRAHDAQASPAANVTTRIMLASGTVPHEAASTTFAANLAGNAAVVFQGTVSLPARNHGGWPAPWQPALPFSQPFPFTRSAAPSLVVDFETTASTATRSWLIEGYRIEGGVDHTEAVQPGCLNSRGRASTSYAWRPPWLVPGGDLLLSMSGYPMSQPSLSLNALLFTTHGVGAPFLGRTTPFPLASLGAPAPAGCAWSIGGTVLGSAPMRYHSSSGGAYLALGPLPIPDHPGLAGTTYFTQALALDTDASGQPQLFPSIAVRWTIGTGVLPAGSKVFAQWRSGSSPAVGRTHPGECATLRLHW